MDVGHVFVRPCSLHVAGKVLEKSCTGDGCPQGPSGELLKLYVPEACRGCETCLSEAMAPRRRPDDLAPGSNRRRSRAGLLREATYAASSRNFAEKGSSKSSRWSEGAAALLALQLGYRVFLLSHLCTEQDCVSQGCNQQQWAAQVLCNKDGCARSAVWQQVHAHEGIITYGGLHGAGCFVCRDMRLLWGAQDRVTCMDLTCSRPGCQPTG